MIRVEIIDYYDNKVKKKYSNTLMRKTNPNIIIWENKSESYPALAASLKKEENDFIFKMNGKTYKNLHYC